MNFCEIALDKVRWSAPKNNKATCSCGTGKIRFQTPRTTIKIAPSAKFHGALELEMDATRFPDEFLDFFDGLRMSAESHLGTDVSDKRYYTPLRRMMAFDDALIFDDQGSVLTEHHVGSYDASLLIQLDGTWSSEASWGLRVRVLQIKLHASKAESHDGCQESVRVFLNGKPLEPLAEPVYKFLPDD